MAICVLLAAAFLASYLTLGRFPGPGVAFAPGDFTSRPWTALTYWLAPIGFLGALFSVLWLWGIGGSVERELGTKRYVAFWIAMTVLGALGLQAGAWISGVFSPLSGPFAPLAAVTVAWGTRNPNAPITFMFVLPLTGKWLAWLSAALLFFSTDARLALFAAIPLVLAWAFAANRLPMLPWSAGSGRRRQDAKGEKRFGDFIGKVKVREQERKDRERLRKLFESSLDDEAR